MPSNSNEAAKRFWFSWISQKEIFIHTKQCKILALQSSISDTTFTTTLVMFEVATETDVSRANRQAGRQHAGEVTKKKKGSNQKVEGPPVFRKTLNSDFGLGGDWNERDLDEEHDDFFDQTSFRQRSSVNSSQSVSTGRSAQETDLARREELLENDPRGNFYNEANRRAKMIQEIEYERIEQIVQSERSRNLPAEPDTMRRWRQETKWNKPGKQLDGSYKTWKPTACKKCTYCEFRGTECYGAEIGVSNGCETCQRMKQICRFVPALEVDDTERSLDSDVTGRTDHESEIFWREGQRLPRSRSSHLRSLHESRITGNELTPQSPSPIPTTNTNIGSVERSHPCQTHEGNSLKTDQYTKFAVPEHPSNYENATKHQPLSNSSKGKAPSRPSEDSISHLGLPEVSFQQEDLPHTMHSVNHLVPKIQASQATPQNPVLLKERLKNLPNAQPPQPTPKNPVPLKERLKRLVEEAKAKRTRNQNQTKQIELKHEPSRNHLRSSSPTHKPGYSDPVYEYVTSSSRSSYVYGDLATNRNGLEDSPFWRHWTHDLPHRDRDP